MSHTRPGHLYANALDGAESAEVGGRVFVSYTEEHLNAWGGGGAGKPR